MVDYNIPVTALAITGKEEISFNPIALRKAKIVYNIDLFESNRANYMCTFVYNLCLSSVFVASLYSLTQLLPIRKGAGSRILFYRLAIEWVKKQFHYGKFIIRLVAI